jgi:AraC family transcriptional regulator, arabinose operon regulatory protein
MNKQPPPGSPPFGWKRQRSRHGVEHFLYPSDLARQLLLYPVAMGRAKTLPGDPIDHLIKDQYLLHFIVHGELVHDIRNRRYVARRGDACLMDLTEKVHHTAGGDRPAVSYWISFNGKDMARYFTELRADREPIFSGLNLPEVTRLIRDLMRLTAQGDLAYEFKASGLLTQVLAELFTVRVRERPMISLGAAMHAYSASVRQGIDWMVRYYEEPYSLKELCARVGVSRSHYSRLFHKETGVPPVVWLNRYRIEQSKRLLSMTDKAISEIAATVGIANQNYFSRLFRSLAGVTPRAFRLACKR